jgi:hypothetical protein
MRFRRLLHGLAGSVLLAVPLAGMSGCSSFSCCHSSCGVGLGRPLLARFRPAPVCETPIIAAPPVAESVTAHVVSGQPCECYPCQPCCHFTLWHWPFCWRLFHRCEECSAPMILAAPEGMSTPQDAQAPPGESLPMPKSLPAAPELKTPPAPGAPVSKPGEQAMAEERPDLVVLVTSPVRRYVGKAVDQTMEVLNRGRAPATGVELITSLPQPLVVEQVSAEGQVAGGDVRWALGTIPPEGSKTVTVQARAAAVAPEVITLASATANEGVKAIATAALEIHGSPALLLKVFDLADPVPVGNDLDYLIQVTNQGTLPAMDLRLRIECPDEVQPVKFTNAPELEAKGQVVEIPAFDLAACGTRMFRLRVHAVQSGDVRFRVYLQGQDLKKEILEEESTRLYSAK